MNKETWKSIKDYNGKYLVSNLGRVKSLNYLRTGKEKILKSQPDKDGYLTLSLSRNGKVKKAKIHRLVAIAFVPNPYNYNTVNHKNENKQNNNVKNLEWCSMKYNNCYGTHPEKMRKKIVCIELKRLYGSISEASLDLQIDKSDICSCCKGKLKTAGGYHWKYYKEET